MQNKTEAGTKSVFLYFLPAVYLICFLFSCVSAEVNVIIGDSGINASTRMAVPRLFLGIKSSGEFAMPGNPVFKIPRDNPETYSLAADNSSLVFTEEYDNQYLVVTGILQFADMDSFLSFLGNYLEIEQNDEQIILGFSSVPDFSEQVSTVLFQLYRSEKINIIVDNQGTVYKSSVSFQDMLEEKTIVLEKSE